MEVIPETRHAH